jgi:hypothetical protein
VTADLNEIVQYSGDVDSNSEATGTTWGDGRKVLSTAMVVGVREGVGAVWSGAGHFFGAGGVMTSCFRAWLILSVKLFRESLRRPMKAFEVHG